jgi:hypothetical protein
MIMRVNIVLGFWSVFLFTGCNPYLTGKINTIPESNKGDSIYVVTPIVETRRQITRETFVPDEEALSPAIALTSKALHDLFDHHLRVKYLREDPDTTLERKMQLDTILKRFVSAEYKQFTTGMKLNGYPSVKLVLIPYLIWTRTTPEFESEKCGPSGRIYTPNERCYWTRSQAYLFLIDNRTSELVYYRVNEWYIRNLRLPFEKGIAYSFRHCSRDLLRSMNRKSSSYNLKRIE